MRLRDWLPLVGLVVCVFLFNMSEFMPIGLLTGIADDFAISESSAGLIISFYAWAVAVLSLPMMLLLRKVQYRTMLLAFVGLFALFQFLSGISTGYWMLLFSRLGVAMAHSVFWSVAPHLAVNIVPPEHHDFALSSVSVGTSVAMIFGLPLGRVIGLTMGWRMSFLTIMAISVILLIFLVAVFPKVENPGTFTTKRLPDIFRNKVIVGIYVMLAVFVTGYFTGYSYIEPFLAQVADMSETLVTLALTVFGIAGIVGSALFTRYFDGRKYVFMTVALCGLGISLFLLLPASVSPVLSLVFVALWGTCAIIFNICFQNEIIRVSPEDGVPIAMSLFSGIYNVGIAMGSIVGGAVIDTLAIEHIGNVGGLCVAASVAFFLLYLLPKIRISEDTSE